MLLLSLEKFIYTMENSEKIKINWLSNMLTKNPVSWVFFPVLGYAMVLRLTTTEMVRIYNKSFQNMLFSFS